MVRRQIAKRTLRCNKRAIVMLKTRAVDTVLVVVTVIMAEPGVFLTAVA